MLRTTFVLFLTIIGTYYALQGPFYALLFYLWNAYFRPEEWVWQHFVRSLNLSFIIGSYLLLSTVLSRNKLVWDGRIALLWSFLGLSFLSAVMSNYSVVSVAYFLEFVKIVVITYLIVVLVTDLRKFRAVILIMVLSLGVLQAKQGWFYLLTSPGWPNNNPVLFLGDNNGTAVGMLMLVPLIGLLAQTTQRKWCKQLFGVLLIGCLYRALSTYSRGGFLAAIAMGGAWWCRSSKKLQKLMVISIILAIILPVLSDTFWARMGTIQTYEEEGDESALGRLHFWSVAVDMAAANPILGVGFNSYNSAYSAYDTSGGAFGPGRSVHNSFFGVLAEVGYVGFCLYICIIWGAFRASSQVRRIAVRDERLADLAKVAVALQASVMAFIVGGSFVALQYNEMFWHLIGLSIALRRLAVEQAKYLASAEQPLSSQPAPLRNPFAA